MAALGFSINNLTLFGLVLAVGIVVDNAIVVVENVERHLQLGISRREAALKTMEEVGGALVSIALVLCAVFVPTAFLGGISGQFFQQFAVTIAVATAISCFCSLTLSPALASRILTPHEEKRPPARWNIVARGWDSFTALFNRIFDRLAHGYAAAADFVIRHTVVMLVIYLALTGSAGWLLATTSQGFIPAQDRGYVINSAQLPGAASLARTTAVVREIERIALDTPGIVRFGAFAGFSGATRTQARNTAALFPVFDEPETRLKKGLSANAITAELRKRLSVTQGASSPSFRRPQCRVSAQAAASPSASKIGRGADPSCWRLRPTNWWRPRASHRISPRCSRRSPPTRRSCSSISIASRRRSSASLSPTSPTRSRLTSARPMSTTSTCLDAPITSRRRPTCHSQGDLRSRAAALPQRGRRHGDARQHRGLKGHLGTRSRATISTRRPSCRVSRHRA